MRITSMYMRRTLNFLELSLNRPSCQEMGASAPRITKIGVVEFGPAQYSELMIDVLLFEGIILVVCRVEMVDDLTELICIWVVCCIFVRRTPKT